MKLPTLPHDKANHAVYGFLIFVLANLFLNELPSFLIVVLAAFAKEFYDEYDYGGFDWIDLYCTIAPALILILV